VNQTEELIVNTVKSTEQVDFQMFSKNGERRCGGNVIWQTIPKAAACHRKCAIAVSDKTSAQLQSETATTGVGNTWNVVVQWTSIVV